MQIIKTKLEGCLVFKPEIYKDKRGFFLETFRENLIKKKIKKKLVQENISFSKKNVLRGLHYQIKKPQGKLVKCVYGKIFDVAVDLRKKSKTYKKWVGLYLDDKDLNQLWIPEGFAHGFLVISKFATVEYKCSNYYYRRYENTIKWDTKSLNINWPVKNPILSAKDLNGQVEI